MNDLQKPIVIFGGGAAALALVAWIWIYATSDGLSRNEQLIKAKASAYKNHYLSSGGESASAAMSRVQVQVATQQAELVQAEKTLVSELPVDFKQSERNEVNARLSATIKELELFAASKNVGIPTLPFKNAPVEDSDDGRRVQMAKAFFMRRALECVLDADIERVTELILRDPVLNPSGSYVLLTGTLTVEAGQTQALNLVQRLREQHERGLGIRELSLTPNSSQRVIVRMVLCLLVRQADSGLTTLRPEGALPLLGTPDSSGAPRTGPSNPTAPAQNTEPKPPGGGPTSRF